MLLMKSLCGKMSLRVGMASVAVSGLLLLAACGGDSGTSAPSDNETSDSEEIQSSSSSEKAKSSSSVILSGDSHEESSSSSSSSSLKSVSSSGNRSSSSSSSEKAKSSSSSKGEAKSSSSNQSSSSSEENDDGWSWDVSKDAYLNPEIDYGSMTDSRDGRIYKTVKIGSQVWMAENLNYADSVKTPSLLKRSWCYNNKAENCAVAGRLYIWAAAIDSVALYDDGNGVNCGDGLYCRLPAKIQGVCPDGWHLPTHAEWKTLFTKVGGADTAGKILKSQTGWYNNGNGTDSVGFSALPAGELYSGNFYIGGHGASFWSASDYSSSRAYSMGLVNDNKKAYLYYDLKIYGFSVRCLKD